MTNEISKAQEEEMSSALIAKILAEDAMVQGNDDYYTEYSNQHRYHEEDDDYEDNSGDDFNPKKLDKYRKKEVKKGRKRKAIEKPVKETTTKKKSDKLEKKTDDREGEDEEKKEEKTVKKAKKPLAEGLNSGVYSEEEEKNFLYGLETYGRDWAKLQELIKTRDGNSIRSHAQKHFIKMFRDNIPLPPKVRESGEGYTLSGKPLDPNSSAAKPYLSRINASKTPTQAKQETSTSKDEEGTNKEETKADTKKELSANTNDVKEGEESATTAITENTPSKNKDDDNKKSIKEEQTNTTISDDDKTTTTTTTTTTTSAAAATTTATTTNTNDEEPPKEHPTTTNESTSITITTTDTNGETTTEQASTPQATPMDIDQAQGATPMDIDKKESTPEKKIKKAKSRSATPSPSSSTGTNESKMYDSNGRTTYSTSRLRRQRAQGSINYGQITKDDDPLTLVKCEPFIGKPASSTAGSQPFELIVDSNVLLAMDFHAHLMTTEIIGFLAGEWDKETMRMHIREVYPCRSLNTGQNDVNVEMDPTSAIEKRQLIEERNLQVVGWYHSHPTFVPDPSLVDIENQRNYQLLCRDHHDTIPTVLEPFVGAIVGPYDQALPASASVINWFHVSGTDRSIPKRLYYELKENDNLTQDEIDRMFELLNEYKTSSEKITFADYWRQDESKLQKMIKSLGTRMPWVQKQLKEGQTVQDSFLERVQSDLKDW